MSTDQLTSIATFLKRVRGHGQAHRWGGLAWMVEGANQALQDLEALRTSPEEDTASGEVGTGEVRRRAP